MKKLIAHILIGLAAVAPLSAVAAPTSADLVRLMKSRGVTMVERKVCTSKDNLATYNSRTNTFCMATSTFHASRQKLDETVTHEAVHVIQDCLAGGLSTSQSSSLADFMVTQGYSREKVNDMFIGRIKRRGLEGHVLDVAKESPANWHARHEAEAYAIMDEPQIVYDLLKKVCR